MKPEKVENFTALVPTSSRTKEEVKELLDKNRIPSHVALIMDGNGRWAKQRGFSRVFGHKNAVKAVREAIEGCVEMGVKYLTLYTFSTENWQRPADEVNSLMQLLVSTLRSEVKELSEKGVKLGAIGELASLPNKCQLQLDESIAKTAHNDTLVLTLALSYSGRTEMKTAIQKIAQKVEQGEIKASQIDEELIAKHLYTTSIPDPELMIRTSGEMRISNFLLWQLAYSELAFLDVLWPDFRKVHLFEAFLSYQNRERRFGKTEDQI
ncbi:isoprenyl transferase [Bernardetia sp.]|uniref:isoprenyl transferase n=1 Tax=Bernardetia sp. TaxID=1937974 RepID=UPI0025BFC5E0|nr:isoprenyl transferase [Bernardetia sp.]